MADRQPELVQLDISRPRSEREAIKNSKDLQALWADGWTIGTSWITALDDDQNPGGTQEQILQLLMLPPRDLDRLAQEERQALASMVERGAGVQDGLDRLHRTTAVLGLALLALPCVGLAIWLAL